MTVQAHIASLEKKHGDLEEELQSVLASPSADDREIAELKRRKLRIKDEVERLKTDTRHSAIKSATRLTYIRERVPTAAR